MARRTANRPGDVMLDMSTRAGLPDQLTQLEVNTSLSGRHACVQVSARSFAVEQVFKRTLRRIIPWLLPMAVQGDAYLTALLLFEFVSVELHCASVCYDYTVRYTAARSEIRQCSFKLKIIAWLTSRAQCC